jgi:hypothetical protein
MSERSDRGTGPRHEYGVELAACRHYSAFCTGDAADPPAPIAAIEFVYAAGENGDERRCFVSWKARLTIDPSRERTLARR